MLPVEFQKRPCGPVKFKGQGPHVTVTMHVAMTPYLGCIYSASSAITGRNMGHSKKNQIFSMFKL